MRRLLLALLLITAGRLLSPLAVPVYDGIGAPDEPYRYVSPPAGAAKTAAPTDAVGQSTVAGLSSYVLSLQSDESGPQFSLSLPPRALATVRGPVVVRAVPLAPTDEPAAARIDGNVYDVTITGGGGAPVRLTAQAALASMILRATTARQPGPVMEHRASAHDPWVVLKAARNGQDSYYSTFPGPGQYALAFADHAPHGGSPLPWVLGGLVLLVAVVVTVRLRAAG